MSYNSEKAEDGSFSTHNVEPTVNNVNPSAEELALLQPEAVVNAPVDPGFSPQVEEDAAPGVPEEDVDVDGDEDDAATV